jgi:hypothetical protein
MGPHLKEPTVDELLEDAPTRALMARDGVQESAVRELLKRVMQARRNLPACAAMSSIATVGSVPDVSPD